MSHTDLATEEDKASGLLHWASMFLANTWEELNRAASGDPTLEEVIDNMYTVNTIPEERTIFEAHQKYLNAMASIESEREEREVQLAQARAELNSTISELSDAKSELNDTRSELNDTRSELSDARSELNDARSELSDTRSELSDTRSELSDTRSELEKLRQLCLANGIDPNVMLHL